MLHIYKTILPTLYWSGKNTQSMTWHVGIMYIFGGSKTLIRKFFHAHPLMKWVWCIANGEDMAWLRNYINQCMQWRCTYSRNLWGVHNAQEIKKIHTSRLPLLPRGAHARSGEDNDCEHTYLLQREVVVVVVVDHHPDRGRIRLNVWYKQIHINFYFLQNPNMHIDSV